MTYPAFKIGDRVVVARALDGTSWATRTQRSLGARGTVDEVVSTSDGAWDILVSVDGVGSQFFAAENLDHAAC